MSEYLTRRTTMATVTLVLGMAALALAADYTYTGGGTDPNKWDDPMNWGGSGYPTGTAGGSNDAAIIPDGFSPSFTAGTVTSYLNVLQTGNGLVTLPAALNMVPRGSPWRSANVVIGTGGLTLTTGGIGFGNNGETGFSSAGPVTMASLQMEAANPTQTGSSYWDITTIRLRGIGSGEIRAWDIRDGANTTITSYGHNGASFTWVGTPVISGGRPNWDLMYGTGWGATGWGKWDLKSFTLYGNRLQIDSNADAPDRADDYLVANGGTIDVNSMRIALGGRTNVTLRNSYVALDNATLLIGGTGTVWENDSTNNKRFSLTNNTTVTFNPNGASAGTATIDTGSTDNGVGGFANNFAFGHLVIGAGDTITLTGTANLGAGNAPLYVNGTLSGAGTINAATRNVYVAGSVSPGSSAGTLTVTGGNLFLAGGASLFLELGGTRASGNYDKLVVGGTLDLSGTGDVLNITTLPGYYAQAGDTFPFVGYSARNGDFSALQWNGWSTDTVYSVAYDDVAGAASLTFLVSIPEPGALALVALAGALTPGRRRRQGV